jgi:hypothetical protein
MMTAADPESVRKALVGAWRLESVVDRRPNGEIVKPFGDGPTGIIFYDALGNMAAQVLYDPQEAQGFAPTPLAKSVASASETELRRGVSGYTAYFGTFLVNANGTITHRLKGAHRPMATDQVRVYELDGDSLKLTVAELAVGTETRRRTLSWRRIR